MIEITEKKKENLKTERDLKIDDSKLKRFQPNIKQGLSREQVKQRQKEDLINKDTMIRTKSIKSIIVKNFFTIFNLMNLLLALDVFAVGSYKNMLFMIIVIINTAISTIQEIYSKKVLDKLSLIASTQVKAIREGKQETIPINEIVLDDILVFQTGNQVVVDSILQEGEIEVNESFITGEAEAVFKKKGDTIFSGSFIVSGKCIAKVEHIGNDNFTSQISNETKYIKKIKSEIMTSLSKVIQTISILIIPIGALLFFNQIGLEGNTIRYAVVNTVAALIGMIPEGLILLTSTVLAVSVIRLSKEKVLVQELYCIETLARVDMLCLDKTGTITEGKMKVKSIVPIHETKEKMEEILFHFAQNSKDSNSSIEAIREAFSSFKQSDLEDSISENKPDGGENCWQIQKQIPFSSDKKWSGITFQKEGSYLLGAPEILLKGHQENYDELLEKYSKEARVLLLARSNEILQNQTLPDKIEVIGLILIHDKVRESAKKTLNYFKEQGVEIRIISGDNPITVSQIAKEAGVNGYEKYIDATSLHTEQELEEAAKQYVIFGRVTPIQKKQLVKAMKDLGHTVAMTGDGVNDIIALKEADCSIAMVSGSDAAKSVSQLVLLDSNFEAMPKIVAEGRRTINNIERSASLFLSKTIYSSLLAVLFVFLKKRYPFMPIQLSLISLVCIGIPSFILALEPNKERVKGRFIQNVFSKSIPAGLTVVFNVILVTIIGAILNIPEEICSTICVILTTLTGFTLLFQISRPFNLLRAVLLVSMIALFTTCAILFKDFFALALTKEYAMLVIILSFTVIASFSLVSLLLHFLKEKRNMGM